MLVEPWNTLLVLVVVPLVVQVLKLLAAKLGKPIPSPAVQGIALVLSVAGLYLSGGFAGLQFPAYSGDIAGFIGGALLFVGAAWGPVELLYNVIYRSIFEKIGL